MPASSMLQLENVFRQSSLLRTRVSLGYLVSLIAVPMARVNILLSLFFGEEEKRKTDSLRANMAVGSLFGQYHHSNILNIPTNLYHFCQKLLFHRQSFHHMFQSLQTP